MTELEWAPTSCTLPTVERPFREREFTALFASSLRAVHQVGATRADLTLDPASEMVARDLAARSHAGAGHRAGNVDDTNWHTQTTPVMRGTDGVSACRDCRADRILFVVVVVKGLAGFCSPTARAAWPV